MRLFALLILFVMNFSCSSESVSKLDFEKSISNYWDSWIEQGKNKSVCVVNLSEIFAFEWDSIVYSPDQNEMSFWDSGKLLDSYISLQKSGCVDFFIKNKSGLPLVLNHWTRTRSFEGPGLCGLSVMALKALSI